MPGARTNAARLGYRGAFYPWNSASEGDLATECHSVDPPHCVTQIHLQGDIAMAAWQYYLATGDTRWLRRRGYNGCQRKRRVHERLRVIAAPCKLPASADNRHNGCNLVCNSAPLLRT